MTSNGSLLALGAVGALALLGGARRGSADKAPPLGPSKPLISGFRYRSWQTRDGLAVFLYKGSKRVGFIDAYWRLSISSIEDESRRAGKDPRWHLACYDDLRALGAEGRNPKVLAVYGTQLDEDVRGKGVGKALYEALMAEAFDENGPFFFVPMACWSSRLSTSPSALRVWASLARAYPSSGVVVRVDSRPVAGSANRASGAYSLADVKALGYSDAEVSKALLKMAFSPNGNPAGPTEAGRMDTDYRGVDFEPPQAVRDAAMKGLRLRKLRETQGVRVDPETGMGPGGMWIGVGRAIQLATAERIPPRDVRRMVNYHSRHKVDKRGKGFGDESRPSNGYVAWLLWGSDRGDEGKRWSERVEREMDARKRPPARGSRSSSYNGLTDAVYQTLMDAGGRLDEDGFSMLGPAPLQRLILTDVSNEDGDPGVWINWIEGTQGQRGAWSLVEQALTEAGADFAAGETLFKEVFSGWKKRGFQAISKSYAEEIYEGASPGKEYKRFLKWLG